MPYLEVVTSADEESATIEYAGTNTVTAGFFSAFLGLFVLLSFALGIAGLANGAVVLSAVFFGLAIAVVWMIKHFVWRPKIYKIHFNNSGIVVGRLPYAYGDIVTHGVSNSGGGAYDPGSMAVPRNVTPGLHVYIALRGDGAHRPITVTLSSHQANRISHEFGHLLAQFAPEPDKQS